ncbi:MAG: 4'-phosphopantetheinyl transferase superfamily protein [Euryarchaeota archaeon]|nr:4'-phosphopantetheinyl transferase superfamily protein [Euryarchaeota archaeon]
MHSENLILSSISLENTLHLWEENDILIFFIDLDSYDVLSTEYLNNTEKEELGKLQTLYFQKRFVISRMVLKSILCILLKMESSLDISTYKDSYGKVHILGHEDLHICISYSENIVALAISKVKIGIDVEIKRPLALKNTFKYFHKTALCGDKSANDADLLKTWTIKEAYCKFFNKTMLSSLSKDPDFNNASYFNFLLDDKYVFSIVTESDQYAINISRLEKIND